ncbi:DUF6916 family protein [Novipirellula sp. SH528]|uniref:DUF6916 family protein n=1 Tax=Novipirellula sp. SH528 TaxID=3454466 RepID=UPI003F9FCAF2
MKNEASSDRREFLKRAGVASAGAVAAVSATELLAASEGDEVAKFSRYIDSEFKFSSRSGESFTAKLSEATASSNERVPGHRQAFSLVFSAPGIHTLPQDTYTVSHPQLGKMELLAVPVDGLARDTRLEVVFA